MKPMLRVVAASPSRVCYILIEHMLSNHNKCNFVAKIFKQSVVFILLFTVCISLASVVVGFGYFAVKDLLTQKFNNFVKWYRHFIMQSRPAWNHVFHVFPWKNIALFQSDL